MATSPPITSLFQPVWTSKIQNETVDVEEGGTLEWMQAMDFISSKTLAVFSAEMQKYFS